MRSSSSGSGSPGLTSRVNSAAGPRRLGLDDLVQQRGRGRRQAADFGHEGPLRRAQDIPLREQDGGIVCQRRLRRRAGSGEHRPRRDHGEQAVGFPRGVRGRDQAFQDQSQRPEWRAQRNPGEQMIDLIGRFPLEPCRECRSCRVVRVAPWSAARHLGPRRHGERQGCCQFGHAAGVGRRQPFDQPERRLCRFLVLALANQPGQVEHRLADGPVRRQGVLQNHRGFLEHALVGQGVGAADIGIGEAMGPLRSRVLPGQLLEDLHRLLEAPLAQCLSASIGKDVQRSREGCSARWRFLHGDHPRARDWCAMPLPGGVGRRQPLGRGGRTRWNLRPPVDACEQQANRA